MKELFELLQMYQANNSPIPNTIMFHNKVHDCYLLKLETCSILFKYPYMLEKQDFINNSDIYISAHGMALDSSNEIDIYNKKCFLYGPDRKVLSSFDIINYFPNLLGKDSDEDAPLAYLYQGLIRPFTIEAASHLTSENLDPKWFSGIHKSLTHIKDYSLSRFEDTPKKLENFLETIAQGPQLMLAMINNKTTLSAVLTELDNNIGIFRSYMMSFCRSGKSDSFMSMLPFQKEKYVHNASNYVSRLDEIDDWNSLRNIRGEIIDFKNLNNNILASPDINFSIKNKLTDTLEPSVNKLITELINDISLTMSEEIVNNKKEKLYMDLRALNILSRSLLHSFSTRRFLLSPNTIKSLKSGKIGDKLSEYCTSNKIANRSSLFKILGFDI